jgi:alcohol dehydrogenase (cytochrome c)
MMALRADDGTKAWGFAMTPTGDRPGADTWQNPAAARTGGATWASYRLDPQTGMLFVPVGNLGPDFNRAVRPGDNLYTNSIVALDGRTGSLKWWRPLVPADYQDRNVSTVALFAAAEGRKLVAAAGKDGNLHLLDRGTGQPLFRVPVITQLNMDAPITPEGTRYCPGTVGDVEWNGPACSPATCQLYVNAVDWCVTSVLGPDPVYVPGKVHTGLTNGLGTYDPVDKTSGWTNAVDVAGAAMTWRYHSPTPMTAAVAPTVPATCSTGSTPAAPSAA